MPRDADPGYGAPILLPDEAGPHPHLVLIGGKDGKLRLLDRDRLDGSEDSSREWLLFRAALLGRPRLALGSNDWLAGFFLKHGQLADILGGRGTQRFKNRERRRPYRPTANRNGIVWIVETKEWNHWSDQPAALHAFDASSVGRELARPRRSGSPFRRPEDCERARLCRAEERSGRVRLAPKALITSSSTGIRGEFTVD